MTALRDRFVELAANEGIRCRLPSATFPRPAPLRYPPHADRIEGMLLGLAIGDSLGNTSESMLPDERAARFGEILDYQPNHHAGGARVGLPSDDTQLSFWTLESLLELGRLDPDDLARRFSSRRIYGMGSAVRSFISSYKAGAPWYEAGPEQAGNGALMRVAPLILPSLIAGGEELIADLALGSMLTHNDSASIAACVAYGIMLRELLSLSEPPSPNWWVSRFIELASQVETDALYTARGGHWMDQSFTLSGFVGLVLPEAASKSHTTREACDSWHSGAYLLETVPSALYILSRHAADPEEALVRAVNDTKDNDSVASIVGAAVGALHGAAALPGRWKEGLSGKTGADDPGRVQDLTRRAGERYGA